MPTFNRQLPSKSETREMAEKERIDKIPRRVNEPTDWKMNSSTFFIAFIVIAAGITIAALVLR